MIKRAIVTGASEGIGRAFVRALAARRWAVTCVARNEARLQELMREIEGDGHGYVVADLGTEAGVRAVLGALGERHTHLLVNNAAFGAVGAFTDVPIETQTAMLRLNVEALTVLSHAFLRQALAGDALVNVSSVVGLLPQPHQPVYSATKAFVTSLTECLWQQMRGTGVHVMGLHPGATDTKFGERAGRDPARPRPRAVRQSAEEVVDEALSALAARRGPTVVTGLPNIAAAAIGRHLPRKLLLATAARVRG